MKKRILFVTNSLGFGGIEKSTVEILKFLDKKSFEIDLLLLNGVTEDDKLLESVPKQINVISSDTKATFFFKSLKEAIKLLVNKKEIGLLFKRIIFTILCNIGKKSRICKKINYNIVKKLYPKIDTVYDYAVCVRYEYPSYYTIDYITANKKYMWLHSMLTDMKTMNLSVKMEREYITKFDSVICVSNAVRNNYIKSIPELTEKITVIHNLVNKDEILRLADVPIDKELKECKCMKFVSMMRFSKEKRPNFIIEVAQRLKNDGLNFIFVLIGDGYMLTRCKKLINKYKLNDRIKLLGFQLNPYPYIKACDVYIQPSLFESWGLGITEAKVLGKPSVTTNFDCASEQIANGFSGYIAKDDTEFYLRLKEIIQTPEIVQKLSRNFYLQIDRDLVESKNKIDMLFSA